MTKKILFILFAFFTIGLGVVGTPVLASDEETVSVSDCEIPYRITSVENDKLFEAFLFIKRCATLDTKLEIYIEGFGGSVNSAQAFFDRMWSSGLAHHVRFIAQGHIASASNLVWLASDERVVTPGSSFLIHEFETNNHTEDEETRVAMKDQTVTRTTNAVRHATNDEAAKIWQDCIDDKRDGVILDGAEALRLGWATELREYK